MKLLDIKQEIQDKIKVLADFRRQLQAKCEIKADTIGKYRKALGIAVFKLSNGIPIEFEGHKIEKMTATNIPMMARAICWKEKKEATEAEAKYKALLAAIESLKAELNGKQSIYKHLD